MQVGDFKAFYFDGSRGLYIHPNIWHEGVFPIEEKSSLENLIKNVSDDYEIIISDNNSTDNSFNICNFY